MFGAAQPNKIDSQLVRDIFNLTPRRICFASYHKTALRKGSGDDPWKFVVPFKESIKKIFEEETGLTLFPSFNSFLYSIREGEENSYEKIKTFIAKYSDTVFLRDCLDLSIALAENLTDKNEHTKIGSLEEIAKYKGDKDAIVALSKISNAFIENTPFYNSSDLICAVPPSNPGDDNLPRNVIKLFENINQKDISPNVNWRSPKAKLKELELNKKWSTLEGIELDINVDIENKSVILIDDLYQSGTTMQFIAMKLKSAGASFVYGLSFVKARNDKDHV